MSKTIYTGVNNVARKVKQPYVGVGNVARKVKSGFIGVNGVARQFFSGGTPISSLAIGSTLYLNESGSSIPYLVVHHGKPSSIYDDSCNGTWLLRKDIIESRVWAASNSNKLANSDIHSWLNSTMLAKYDTSIQNAIKQVKIPYMSNGGGGYILSGANGLSCKVFLLSGYELGWTDSDSFYTPQDGAKLAYFESGIGTSANNKRIAYLNGSATVWWLRSPSIMNTIYVRLVWNDGASDQSWHQDNTTSSYGIRPALIMPSNTLIDTSTNTIII